MIVVFTGGDEPEDNDETFEEYVSRECPEPFQKFPELCNKRVVFFDNKTKDQRIQSQQVTQLFSLVDSVVKNNGQPYSNEFFAELKKGASLLNDKKKEVESLQGNTEQEKLALMNQLYQQYDDQFKRITEMVEARIKEAIKWLVQQLAEEHAALLKAQEAAKAAQTRSNDEIRKLRESLEKAQREIEDLRRKAEGDKCAIL